MKPSQNPELFDALEIGSPEALASARYLWRLSKQMKIAEAAKRCHVALHNAYGIVALMDMWQGRVPDKRIACVSYRDPSVEPSDVAEWWCQPLNWAEHAYKQRKKLVVRYPGDLARERQACGLHHGDPLPFRITAMCETFVKNDPAPWLRVLTWDQVQERLNAASVSRLVG